MVYRKTQLVPCFFGLSRDLQAEKGRAVIITFETTTNGKQTGNYEREIKRLSRRHRALPLSYNLWKFHACRHRKWTN